MRARPWLTRLWAEFRRFLLLLIGTLIAAVGYAVFQVPYNIAAGGVSGIGIIVNHFTGFSVGAFYLLANLPLFVLGFFTLGGWRFLLNTVISVLLFSAATEAIERYLPIYLGPEPITADPLLSAIFAGLIGGIGAGLIFAAGATMGGTGIVGRILQFRTGIPLSQIYLWVDGVIVVTAAFVFGWESALYAMLTLLLSGLAADYALEGPSRARNAIIITTEGEKMTQALMAELERGVSHWEATGGYTGEARTVIFCTIYRPQVNDLKEVISKVDPLAFVSIGITQEVIGSGFSKLRP
ncbi:MAG: YitT family protein [Caldilineaceae bacterium]|nr:YitT family protein [Caldilineaceae bacterium]